MHFVITNLQLMFPCDFSPLYIMLNVVSCQFLNFLFPFWKFSSALEFDEGNSNIVTEEDLEHLCQLVEVKDGGPTWIQMMDRSAPAMYCKAWRRDPKVAFSY